MSALAAGTASDADTGWDAICRGDGCARCGAGLVACVSCGETGCGECADGVCAVCLDPMTWDGVEAEALGR